MASSTLFPVSNVDVSDYGEGTYNYRADSLDIKNTMQYKGNNCTEVLLMSNFPMHSDLDGESFVNTVFNAYCFHYNLIIRPDDIWAAMMSQFALYISSKKAEDLLKKFGNFGGKETVVVVSPGTLKDLKSDEFNKLMSSQVDANVTDPGLKEWIFPKFSTTTETDTVTVGLLFMASMKEYARPWMTSRCGIPNITLEGTAKDWQDLLDKLEKLKEYKLEKWYDLLKPVIQQFLKAKQGTVDTVFWQRICHEEPTNGSSGTDYLSGWITVFCVFDVDGNWIESNWEGGSSTGSGAADKDKVKIDYEIDEDGDLIDDANDDGDPYNRKKDENLKDWPRIDLEKIPNELFEVNVEMKDGTDEVFQTVLMGGHMGVHVKDHDEALIQPVLGWAVCLKGPASDAPPNKKKKDENENVDNEDNGGNEDDVNSDEDYNFYGSEDDDF